MNNSYFLMHAVFDTIIHVMQAASCCPCYRWSILDMREGILVRECLCIRKVISGWIEHSLPSHAKVLAILFEFGFWLSIVLLHLKCFVFACLESFLQHLKGHSSCCCQPSRVGEDIFISQISDTWLYCFLRNTWFYRLTCFVFLLQEVTKRLSLPADIRLPENFLAQQSLSLSPDGQLTRRSRRKSLVCVS